MCGSSNDRGINAQKPPQPAARASDVNAAGNTAVQMPLIAPGSVSADILASNVPDNLDESLFLPHPTQTSAGALAVIANNNNNNNTNTFGRSFSIYEPGKGDQSLLLHHADPTSIPATGAELVHYHRPSNRSTAAADAAATFAPDCKPTPCVNTADFANYPAPSLAGASGVAGSAYAAVKADENPLRFAPTQQHEDLNVGMQSRQQPEQGMQFDGENALQRTGGEGGRGLGCDNVVTTEAALAYDGFFASMLDDIDFTPAVVGSATGYQNVGLNQNSNAGVLGSATESRAPIGSYDVFSHQPQQSLQQQQQQQQQPQPQPQQAQLEPQFQQQSAQPPFECNTSGNHQQNVATGNFAYHRGDQSSPLGSNNGFSTHASPPNAQPIAVNPVKPAAYSASAGAGNIQFAQSSYESPQPTLPPPALPPSHPAGPSQPPAVTFYGASAVAGGDDGTEAAEGMDEDGQGNATQDSEQQDEPIRRKGPRTKFSKEAVDCLNSWFLSHLHHPYPTELADEEEEYQFVDSEDPLDSVLPALALLRLQVKRSEQKGQRRRLQQHGTEAEEGAADFNDRESIEEEKGEGESEEGEEGDKEGSKEDEEGDEEGSEEESEEGSEEEQLKAMSLRDVYRRCFGEEVVLRRSSDEGDGQVFASGGDIGGVDYIGGLLDMMNGLDGLAEMDGLDGLDGLEGIDLMDGMTGLGDFQGVAERLDAEMEGNEGVEGHPCIQEEQLVVVQGDFTEEPLSIEAQEENYFCDEADDYYSEDEEGEFLRGNGEGAGRYDVTGYDMAGYDVAACRSNGTPASGGGSMGEHMVGAVPAI
ncbi:unnamed protein product [Closterium sp. Yama58-4]|nr:unnamed protein product [Closterium sp. Yama58-4]